MDGYNTLTTLDKSYARAWDDCIPTQQLSLENLPPFFARLRNDQVGHLLQWIEDKNSVSLPQFKANHYWPFDIARETGSGAVRTRTRWGKAYDGKGNHGNLSGGPNLPTFMDVGLPLTYTSSGKAMCREHECSTSQKRKSSDMLEEKIDGGGKRFCTWAKPETADEVMQAFKDNIGRVKAECKAKIEVLETDIEKKDHAMGILKQVRDNVLDQVRELEGTIEQKDKHMQQIIEQKDRQIEHHNDEIALAGRALADLECLLSTQRTKTDKLEAKIKRQDKEIASQRSMAQAEYKLRTQIEEQKKKELQTVRKDAKDAKTKAKILESTVLDKDEIIRAHSEALRTDKQRILSRNKQFIQMRGALKRCKEIVDKEVGDLEQDSEDSGSKVT